jgi:hypothetical protein
VKIAPSGSSILSIRPQPRSGRGREASRGLRGALVEHFPSLGVSPRQKSFFLWKIPKHRLFCWGLVEVEW